MAGHVKCILPFFSESEGHVYKVSEKCLTSEIRPIIDNLLQKLSSCGMSKEKENEIKILYQTTKNLEANFIKTRMILNAAWSTCAKTKDSNLAVKKMAKIIATKDLKSLATVDSDKNVNTSLCWLGIKIGKSPELSVQEKIEIQSLVEADIVCKGTEVRSNFHNNDVSKRKVKAKREEIQDILTGIRKNIPVYNTEVYKYVQTMKEVLNYKERFYSTDSNNQKWLDVKSEYLELKARLLHHKYLHFFYTEDPKIIEALSVLHECLEVELEAMKPELNKLLDVSNAYAKLRGTEYDYILNGYLKALKEIKEKKKTLQKLKFSE